MSRFSIVIPTRNRPQWLKPCLEKTLQQDFSDFEIVVTDNSDPGDSPTEAIIRDISSDKIRYIRTGGLSMADNWQRAVHAAKGEYFIICSDKLVLANGLLKFLDKKIKTSGETVYVWKIGTEAQLQDLSNCLNVEAVQVAGNDIWQSAAAGQWTILHKCAARGMNSCIKRSLVETMEARLGVNFCRPTTPDYVIALSLAAFGNDSCFFDLIGSGFMANADGTGMLCLVAADENEIKGQFSFPEIRELPLPFALGTNLIYQDILAINRLVPATSQVTINWENYFLQIIHTAVNADELGGFGPKRKILLKEALARRPLKERLSLLKTICHQETLNLVRGKYSPNFQIRRLAHLLKYSLPPVFGRTYF